jgi:hypothetical protein
MNTSSTQLNAAITKSTYSKLKKVAIYFVLNGMIKVSSFMLTGATGSRDHGHYSVCAPSNMICIWHWLKVTTSKRKNNELQIFTNIKKQMLGRNYLKVFKNNGEVWEVSEPEHYICMEETLLRTCTPADIRNAGHAHLWAAMPSSILDQYEGGNIRLDACHAIHSTKFRQPPSLPKWYMTS